MPLRYTFDHHYLPEQTQGLSCLERIKLPATLKVLTWLLLCGLLLSLFALVTVPWVQSTSGMGRVTTLDPRDRVQNISALVSGRVAEWYVRDGAEVAAGDPIVRIEDIDNSLIERLQGQLDAARRRLDAARENVRTAAIDLNRREQLLAQGLSSRLEFEQADIRMQQMRIAEEQASADLNQAEVNLSRQGSQLVVAPRAGTIVHVEAGDVATVVSAGQALASFMPANSERAIEIFVDGRDIGLVRPGRQARIEFEGWPAFQFSGMPDLAVGTFPGEVFFVEPSARPDGRFRVLIREVRQDPCSTAALRPGMNPSTVCGWPPESFVRLGASARAWVQLETVPLGYELWRLLNNFPPLSVAAASAVDGSR